MAAKTVAKASIKTQKTKDKLLGEIRIHKVLKHPNIVKFIDCFEDDVNVYILLEMCSNNSLMNMLRKRKTFTEAESKFFLTQIIGGVAYMHEYGVIHRDLKLGNIFLDDSMNVKIGDFGLAAVLSSESERKKTICGTPNYIAPEVLYGKKEGHSYEVDVWSVGVILYAMVVGKPPFQSKDVDTIYKRIKDNDYHYPDTNLSFEVKNLINSFLRLDPTKRIKLDEALSHSFFKMDFPDRLSTRSLTEKPEFTPITLSQSEANFINCKVSSRLMLRPTSHSRKSDPILKDMTTENVDSVNEQKVLPASLSPASTKEKYRMIMLQKNDSRMNRPVLSTNKLSRTNEANIISDYAPSERTALGKPRRIIPTSENHINIENVAKTAIQNNARRTSGQNQVEKQNLLRNMTKTTQACFLDCHVNPSKTACVGWASKLVNEFMDKLDTSVQGGFSHDPYPDSSYRPHAVFITKWVDYSNKYGIAYQLSTGIVGVLFKDNSTTQMNTAVESFDTIRYSISNDRWMIHHTMDISKCLPSHTNKFRLVKSMYSYMQKNLRESSSNDEDSCISHEPKLISKNSVTFMVHYMRLGQIVMFQLNNGSFQFNFPDHTKILMSEDANTIGFIDSERRLHCWSLSSGRICCKPFYNQIDSDFLTDLYDKLERVLSQLVVIQHSQPA